MYHTSHTPVALTDRPLFLSFTEAEAIAWGGAHIYCVTLKGPIELATREQTQFLCCNPDSEEIRAVITQPLLVFQDYSPFDFDKDTLSILCLNPLESIDSFLPLHLKVD